MRVVPGLGLGFATRATLSMRVLFTTVSAASYMRPPVLGDEQIVCGPDWADDIAPDGRVRALRTPAGAYDLGEILARLPAAQRPDVVVCLADASRRNLPRNLRAFTGPKILLIADTHHLQAPIMTMIRYAASEPFDQMVLLYDRHHAGIFRAAGFKNLHWFPGLTFPHSDATVRASWHQGPRRAGLAFVGQAGARHPRRTRLLARLAAAGLPLEQKVVDQAGALPFYGSSLLGFNASLNGDLNLRVFEVLASGAFLLTDRLAPAAGLRHLITEDRDAVFYADEHELAAKAASWLREPRETQVFGEAAARRFLERFGEHHRRTMFTALALNGTPPEPFPVFDPGTIHIDFGGMPSLLAGAMVYEGVQELHRAQEEVRVVLDPAAPESFAQLCGTLPRVRLSRGTTAAGADLFVTPATNTEVAAASGATRVWCSDVTPTLWPELNGRMTAAGYQAASKDLAVYARPAPVAAGTPTPAEQAAQARLLYQRGDHAAALELGRTALQRDGRCVEALTLLADLALLRQGGPLAEKLYRHAVDIVPTDAALVAGLAEALLQQEKLAEADTRVTAALRLDPAALRALLVQARLREKQERPLEAIAALRAAATRHPASAAPAQLGLLLRRQGRVLEGLDWQRRALGATDEIVPVDPAKGPVRVAFLVQHPQGWTSLESVWRAMADDQAFAPVIIAAPYQHPYPPEGGPDAIFGFLAKQGVPFVRWDQCALTPGFADVLFVQNPYDQTRPAPLHVPALLKLVPRLAYVPYGLEIGGGERNNGMVMNMPLQQLAWLVGARSERQRLAYARHCHAGNAHVKVTGHAKLDALRDLAALKTPVLDRFAAGRKLVAWNPHFDIRPNQTPWGEGFSTFTRWCDFMLGEFERRGKELALVIRPHPLFFGTLEARRIWTRAQTDAFMRRIGRAGNIVIDREPSYLPLFARADALMSDASSFVLEFAATGKPLLYLHNPQGPQLNDDGDFVRDHCHWGEQEDEIRAFLDQTAAGTDPRGPARRAAFPQYLHQPKQGAGRAVADAVLARLQCEAAPAGHADTCTCHR